MNNPVISNSSRPALTSTFAWMVLLAVGAGVLFPVSLSLLPGVLSIAAVCMFGPRAAMDVIAENKKTVFWIAGICALCFASAIFSIEPKESLERAAKITALVALSMPVFLLAGRFPDNVVERILSWLPHVLIATGAVLSIELHFNFPIYKFIGGGSDEFMPVFLLNKNVAVFVLLLPVAMWAAWTRRKYMTAGALAVVACGIMSKTDSQAAQLALIALFCAALLFRLPRRIFIHGAFAFTALLLVSFPFFSQYAMDNFAESASQHERTYLGGASVAMRLENYDFLSKRILESPVVGHGIDTTRYMTFDTEEKYFPGNTILHPHNAHLQVWMEFGAVGVSVFLGFLVFLWSGLRRMTGAAGFLSVAFFCMMVVFLSISWSLWASWLVGATILLSAVVRVASVQRGGSDVEAH